MRTFRDPGKALEHLRATDETVAVHPWDVEDPGHPLSRGFTEQHARAIHATLEKICKAKNCNSNSVSQSGENPAYNDCFEEGQSTAFAAGEDISKLSVRRNIANSCNHLYVGGTMTMGCARCRSKSKPPEIRICPANFAPVCGKNGKTYSNACNAGDTPIAHEGPCASKSETNWLLWGGVAVVAAFLLLRKK